jgi:hypothetical protein
MPPKRGRTDADRDADRDRRAASRAQQQAAASSSDPVAAANALAEFQEIQARDRASQALDAHRSSQAASRAQQQAAASSSDPGAAAGALAEFQVSQARDRASQARDANRSSQSASRAQAAAQRASQSAHAGAQLDALLYVDTFTSENIDLIEKNFERNVSAALCYFSANTAVAFGMRRDVSMDAQLWDVLGDPTDPNSAANGVTAETKAACIERCMKKLGQRELRACVACGVRRRPL